ncbi:MAG: MarR family winged helix-turn-helix transcriptional regulator [Limnohabitans sp.]
MSTHELASIVLAKQPAVTKLEGRMQDAGWVQHCDAAHDKRQSLVSLTAAGRRKVQPLRKQAKVYEAQVVPALGSDLAHQLKRMLESLTAANSCCCAKTTPLLGGKLATGNRAIDANGKQHRRFCAGPLWTWRGR